MNGAGSSESFLPVGEGYRSLGEHDLHHLGGPDGHDPVERHEHHLSPGGDVLDQAGPGVFPHGGCDELGSDTVPAGGVVLLLQVEHGHLQHGVAGTEGEGVVCHGDLPPGHGLSVMMERQTSPLQV